MINQHPYRPGRWLHFDTKSSLPPAQILRTFEGSPGAGFTNSCSTLVEFSADVAGALEGRRFLVKSFDPRFSTHITRLCENESWPASSTDAHDQRRQDFLRWYYAPVPRCAIDESELVAWLAEQPDVPRGLCHGDVVRYAFSYPDIMPELVAARILPRLTDIQRQFVAEELCAVQCDYERGVLEEATKVDGTRTFPAFACVTRIQSSTDGVDDSVALDAPAIVMEFIEGDTLAAWLDAHPIHTSGTPDGPDDRARADMRDICEGIVFANGVSMALGLVPTDPHTSNHLVVRDRLTGRLRIRLIDAGGHLLLSRLRRPAIRHPMLRPQDHLETLERLRMTSNAFYVDAEYYSEGPDLQIKALLDQHIRPRFPASTCELEFNLLLPNLMCRHADPLDTLYWQLVRLVSWRCHDPHLSMDSFRRTLIRLRQTTHIVDETLTTHPDRQTWGLVAFYRVSMAYFAEDAYQLVVAFAICVYRVLSRFKDTGREGVARAQQDDPAFIEEAAHAMASMVSPKGDADVSLDHFQAWTEEQSDISRVQDLPIGWLLELTRQLDVQFDVNLAVFSPNAQCDKDVSEGDFRRPDSVTAVVLPEFAAHTPANGQIEPSTATSPRALPVLQTPVSCDAPQPDTANVTWYLAKVVSAGIC